MDTMSSLSNPSTPRTPLRTLQPDDVKKTPGGLSLDIVLTPALRPAPRSASKSLNSSPAPITSAEISEKISNAATRREGVLLLRKENIDQKLALVQSKKDELVNEKAAKTKEDLDAKLKASEENKSLIIEKTKNEVKAHLAKVEQKVKDLEVSNESEKVAQKLALEADIMKADEKRTAQMEKRMKEIQEHVEYVKLVNETQELKKKTYLTKLEVSLENANKRKEEVVAKVVESAKEEEAKVEEAKLRREKEEKELQLKVKAVLDEKSVKVVENQAVMEEAARTKAEERNRKADLVRQNKMKMVQEGGDMVPESA